MRKEFLFSRELLPVFFEVMQKFSPIADDFYNILKDTQRRKIALNKTLVGNGKYKRVAKYIRLYNIFGE